MFTGQNGILCRHVEELGREGTLLERQGFGVLVVKKVLIKMLILLGANILRYFHALHMVGHLLALRRMSRSHFSPIHSVRLILHRCSCPKL